MLFAILLLLGNLNSFSCQWTHPVEVGAVRAPIAEDSGLAVSRNFPDRIYHINDSGDTGRFFLTDFSGRKVRTVNVKGFAPKDTEDLGIGKCSATADCLFIGDIGDNSRRRPYIEIVIIEEREDFGVEVDPQYRVQMRYPTKAFDAESLAVHPDGSVYILTKGGVPELYRLRKDQWMNSQGQMQTLEFVAAIDFEKLGGPAAAFDGRFPTSMAISPDGKRVLVLTYRNVFELSLDLAEPLPPVTTWVPGEHYRLLDIEVLPQQEAIAYLPDGRSFIYDTEAPANGRAQIMRSDCR